ncbi:MAG: tetratricopeptide repeat protein [Gemmatimonadota bacterium]
MEAIRRAEVAGLAPPPAALNGLGDAYLDLGDETLAGDHHLQAAEGFAAEGLYDNAIACCRKVLRRSEGHSRAGLLLGRYYAAKGLKAEALEILGGIAKRRDEAGERRDAVTAMEEVVRIAPATARLRERLGRLLQEEGRREDALREYQAALELCLQAGDPAGAEHARTRIEALEAPVPEPEMGSAPEPRGGVRRPEEPEHLAAMRGAAAEAFSAGRWADAAEAYGRLAAAGASGPDEFAAWTESARRSGRAAAVLRSLDALALWHLDGNRPTEARRAAEEMLLIDPGNEAAMGLLERADSLLSAER